MNKVYSKKSMYRVRTHGSFMGRSFTRRGGDVDVIYKSGEDSEGLYIDLQVLMLK